MGPEVVVGPPPTAAAVPSIDLNLRADLRDASRALAETSSALALSMREGDLVAAERLLAFLIDLLPDRRVVVTDVLTPLVTDEWQLASDASADERFVATCSELLDRLRQPVRGAGGALLHASCRCRQSLTLQMTALLLDDARVPATLLLGDEYDDTSVVKQVTATGAPVVCLAVCDPSRLPDREGLIRSLRRAERSVVLLGGAMREAPEAARLLGATAGVWHAGETTDLLLRLRGPLTAAETEVLKLAADGYTNARIAHELEITVSAVKARLESAYARVGAADRAHAVAIALRKRWIG